MSAGVYIMVGFLDDAVVVGIIGVVKPSPKV
jgi:uncharacterized membrane protein YbaN (DUF454 family)